MARKDELLKNFLEHELLISKYNLEKAELPTTVRDALKSPIPIVNAIAKIIESLESNPPSTDTALRNLIIQYLNDAAI
ncbi:MAG: hypothetical protein AB7S48_07225 [Bacteroidales bacterium]